MLTFFRDSLQADIKDQIYSVVIIDGDLPDNVKVVVGAARVNQTSENEGMFGRFFLARPDFELTNFEKEELEEILWKWVAEYTETSPSQADRELLHSCVKDATGSTDFFAGVGYATRSLPQLTGYEKGEEWGAKLIDYAWEHPFKQYRKRQLIEAAELTIRWEKIIHMERYDVSKNLYMIDLAACRRERIRGLASGTASAYVVDGTRSGRERNTITGRTSSVMMREVGLEACHRSQIRPRIQDGSA